MALPLIPLAIGAGSTLAGGLLSGWGQSRAQRKQIEAQQGAAEEAQRLLDEAYGDVYNQLSPIQQQLAIQDTLSKLQGYEFTDMDSYGRFSPSKDVEAWLDPYRDFATQQMEKSVLAGQAAGGSLRSGAALKELQDRSNNLANQYWQNASQSAYGDYMNRFQSAQQANQNQYNQLSNLANMGMNLEGQMANLRMAQAGSQANTVSTLGQLQGLHDSAQNWWMPALGQGLSGAGQAVGSYMMATPSQAPSVIPQQTQAPSVIPQQTFGATVIPQQTFGATQNTIPSMDQYRQSMRSF